MKTPPIWIGSRPYLVCKQFKKDLLLQPWQTGIRIQFRFETVWCVRQGNDLVLNGGALFPITEVYTNGKTLIGMNDAYQTGLDYNADALAFRKALDQRNIERCPISTQ